MPTTYYKTLTLVELVRGMTFAPEDPPKARVGKGRGKSSEVTRASAKAKPAVVHKPKVVDSKKEEMIAKAKWDDMTARATAKKAKAKKAEMMVDDSSMLEGSICSDANMALQEQTREWAWNDNSPERTTQPTTATAEPCGASAQPHQPALPPKAAARPPASAKVIRRGCPPPPTTFINPADRQAQEKIAIVSAGENQRNPPPASAKVTRQPCPPSPTTFINPADRRPQEKVAIVAAGVEQRARLVEGVQPFYPQVTPRTATVWTMCDTTTTASKKWLPPYPGLRT